MDLRECGETSTPMTGLIIGSVMPEGIAGGIYSARAFSLQFSAFYFLRNSVLFRPPSDV